MLKVDRDIDDDRTFELAVHQHRTVECPGDFGFADDTPWIARTDVQPEPAV